VPKTYGRPQASALLSEAAQRTEPSQSVLQRHVVNCMAEQRTLPLRATSSKKGQREGIDKRHAFLEKVHKKQRRELLLKQHAMYLARVRVVSQYLCAKVCGCKFWSKSRMHRVRLSNRRPR
jgi:hypothetical protein